MAFEKRQILGEVTGTLGDVVRRKRYGKIIVSSRPSKYKKSKSKLAVEGRNSFALSVAFAKTVNSNPELKQVWQYAKLDGVVAYNRVIKYNKQFIKDGSLTTDNIITPAGVFLSLTEFVLTENNILLKINLKEKELKKLLQTPFHLHTINYAFNPLSSVKERFVISGQSSIIEQLPVNGIYSIDIKLDKAVKQFISKNKSLIVYTSASNFRGNKKEVFWTSTVAKQFNF